MEQIINPVTRLEFYLASLSGMDVQPPSYVTRLEHYLQDIIDGNASAIVPVTRVEYYLAKISGADVSIPAPVTRLEVYLAKIAGMEVETPEPVTRLEYWLYMWAEAGPGGVVETVTGNLPLTLANALSHAILSLTRYGLCTQESTPTPSVPQDILCNNGVIKVSRNMCDVNSTTASIGYYISAQGVVTADVYNWMYQSFIPVLPSTTYTLSFDTSVYYVSISEYATAENSGFVVRKNGSTGSNTSLTITTEATTKFIRFGTNIDRTNVTLEEVLAINWMLAQGDTAETYHPYKDLWVEGDAEELTVRGKNVYDVRSNPIEQGNISSTTGQNTGSNSRVRTRDYIPVKPNTTYTISATIEGYTPGASKGVFLYQYNSDASEWDSSGWKDANGYTFTTGETTAKIRAVFAKAGSGSTTPDMVSNLQVEEGSTATAYEPYVTPQTASVVDLLGVGDYKDAHDIISGSIERNVGVILYDGSEDESWSRLGTNAFAVTNSIKKVGKYAMLCSHYVYTAATSANCSSGEFGCSSGTPRTVYFKNELYDTVDDWRAALAADPIIVVYPLATPTTEHVTPQHLVTHNGVNVVDSTANVSPVNLECTYIAADA